MTQDKKTRGRPPMEDRSKLRKFRGMRFSDEEYDRVRALAEKAGLSVSAFVRERALAKR